MSSFRPWYDRSGHSLYDSQSLRLRQIAFLRLVRERIDIEVLLWLWNNVRDPPAFVRTVSNSPGGYHTGNTTPPVRRSNACATLRRFPASRNTQFPSVQTREHGK